MPKNVSRRTANREKFAADFANRFTKSPYSMRDAVRPAGKWNWRSYKHHKPEPSCQSDAYEFSASKVECCQAWVANNIRYLLFNRVSRYFGLVLIQNFIFVFRMSLQ